MILVDTSVWIEIFRDKTGNNDQLKTNRMSPNVPISSHCRLGTLLSHESA